MSKIIVSFRRHSKPDKDPTTGASLDSLCEEGHVMARTEGERLSYQNIIGYYSGLIRAEQTLDGIYQGANMSGAPKEISDLLKPITIDKEKTMFPALKDSSGRTRNATELTNYLLDSNNLQPTDETLYEAGERLYKHLLLSVGAAIRDYGDKEEIYVENITHAPVVDGGLLYLRKLSNGEEVTDIGQFGGGFDPCDNYKVIMRNNNGLSSLVEVEYKGNTFTFLLSKADVENVNSPNSSSSGNSSAESDQSTKLGEGAV